MAPSKRPLIFQEIRKERGELGLVQVATFGTEGTKSAILTSCRGYRSEDFPDGIDVDVAQYMSSLIPSHRGFLWPLKDVVYGNADEDRKPVTAFVNEVNQYPGLLEIMLSIEGLINKRSTHASGVILYDEDIFETAAVMKTPGGDLITQYSLHDAEEAGDTKYDFLVTEISDKMISCVELLVLDQLIEDAPLRTLYNKYLHPQVIDTQDQRIWDALGEGSVLDVFQFATGVGLAVAKKIKPQNPIEMTAANALMRLMAEKGKESPQDRFARFKNNISLWYKELRDEYLLKDHQIKALEKYYLEYYGCVPLQEQMMLILMDSEIGNFTLAEANDARKIVAKKQMSRIPELKEKVFSHITDEYFANYIWDTAIAPSLGYAFSLNHSLPYSFVGIQTLYLATSFNPIYWNTACLIVNSGSLENLEDEKSTDYSKIAKAIGDIMSRGIRVSLVDINRSDFGFKPDQENNEILYGMKGVNNVGSDLVYTIIQNRPYHGLVDFLNKVKVNKQAVIALIKSGAFDRLEGTSRKMIMAKYIWMTCERKKRLTLQNFNGLVQHRLVPDELDFERRVFNFNKYLKANCKHKEYYLLDEVCEKFFSSHYDTDELEIISNLPAIRQKTWDKYYQESMDKVRVWLKNSHDKVLEDYNKILFKQDWDKYAEGTISSWEMESLCFYYHEHELAHVNKDRYGVVNFSALPEAPEIDYVFKKGMAEIPIYKLTKIVGTVIAKNKTKSSISLLTVDGVVEVKFRNEYFSLFDKQLSEKQSDGTKKIIEKSWFNRGSMLMLNGYRRENEFVTKKYSQTNGHQLYKIDSIDKSGNLVLKSERYGAA